jgi:hypothetical protein
MKTIYLRFQDGTTGAISGSNPKPPAGCKTLTAAQYKRINDDARQAEAHRLLKHQAARQRRVADAVAKYPELEGLI